MGVIVDIHGWRGLSWDRDLFNWKLTVCFLTVMLCKFCVTDRLKIIADGLAEAKAILEGK